MACYDGKYPVAYDASLDKEIMERRKAVSESPGSKLKNDERQAELL